MGKLKSHQFPESPPHKILTNRWLPCWPTTYGNSNLCHTYHRKCCQALSHSSAKDLTFVGIALFAARCQVLKGRILYLDETVDLPDNRLWRYMCSFFLTSLDWSMDHGWRHFTHCILNHLVFCFVFCCPTLSLSLGMHPLYANNQDAYALHLLPNVSGVLCNSASTIFNSHLAPNCRFCTHQLLVPLRISVRASHLRPRWETAQPAAMWKIPSQKHHWTLSIPSHHHCMSPTHGACLRIPELTVIGLKRRGQQLIWLNQCQLSKIPVCRNDHW